MGKTPKEESTITMDQSDGFTYERLRGLAICFVQDQQYPGGIKYSTVAEKFVEWLAHQSFDLFDGEQTTPDPYYTSQVQ